ncbi:MAG TPA: gamma-glutamyl-phosphate reductase, partial [Candidatus Angelobacter sp.]|nr:gamma-glutamyl-phosphate reductase [Candidatus Angelobacter sp.]
MSSATEFRNPESIAAQVQATRRAARELARLSADQRNQILLAAADGLEEREAELLNANQED